ncbi:MAG: hypothetical protein IJV38_07255 [Prevotella sp.]|nr:hypothetical protein [Prevotella sp.]
MTAEDDTDAHQQNSHGGKINSDGQNFAGEHQNFDKKHEMIIRPLCGVEDYG